MMYKPVMVDLLLVLGLALLPASLAADSSSPPPTQASTTPAASPTKSSAGGQTTTPSNTPQGKTVTVTTTITHTATTVLTATQEVLDHSTVNSVVTVTDSSAATETDVVWVTITDAVQKRAVAFPTSGGSELRQVVPRQAAGTVTVTETKDVTSFITSTTTVRVTSVDTTTVLQTKTKVLNAQTTVSVTSTTHVTAAKQTTVNNAPSNTDTGSPGQTTTPPPAPSPDSGGSGLSGGAIGGIAAGAAVAVIAVVLGLFLFFRRRRNNRANDDDYFYDPNGPSTLNNTAMKQPTLPDIKFMFTPQHHSEPYNAAANVPYSDTVPYSDRAPGASNLAGLAPTLPVLDRGDAISPASSGRLSPGHPDRSPSPATLVGSPPLSASATPAVKKDWRSSAASAGHEQEADSREVPEVDSREVARDVKPESYEMDASSPPIARHPAFREDVPEMDGQPVRGYEMDATESAPRQELASSSHQGFIPYRRPGSGSQPGPQPPARE